jgi:tetratricopeptide (TPR) repeat protein
VLGQQAQWALTRKDFASALELGERYEEIVRAGNAKPSIEHAWAARQRGVALEGLGRLDEAQTAFEEALAANDAALGPAHPERAWPLERLAKLHETRGELEAATETDAILIDLLRRSRAEGDHKAILGHALHREAQRKFEYAGAYALSIELAAEALDLFAQLHGPHSAEAQSIRCSLARIRLALGDDEAVARDVDVLLEHADTLEHARDRVDAHGMRALLAARAADEAAAAEALQRAETAAGEKATLHAVWLEWAADVARAQGEIEEALSLAEQALAGTEPTAMRATNRARTRVGQLRLDAGMTESAATPLEQVIADAAERRTAWPFLPDAELALAKVRASEGELTLARRLAEKAYAGYRELGPGRAEEREATSAWLAALGASSVPQ